MSSHDLDRLPDDLPAPEDDGGADHLPGTALPDLALPASDGTVVRMSALDRVVVYAYPRTGVPGQDPLVPGWDAIPGARGCTPESCGFRDERAALQRLGYGVLGLSTQDSAYQQEMAVRLHLGFPVLSDSTLALTRALRLPTFDVAGQTLLRRLTMLVVAGGVEHVWYPVFPPDTHAREVHEWLAGRSR